MNGILARIPGKQLIMHHRRGLAVAIAVSLCFTAYQWIAVPPAPLFGPIECRSPAKDGAYNLLTDALLAGQTYLKVEPSATLKALDDPYDPLKSRGPGILLLCDPYDIANVRDPAAVVLGDASYYREKYYFYFGITPAVTLFVPFRIATGAYLSEQTACVIFAAIAVLFFGLLLNTLLDEFFPSTTALARLLLLVTYGACSCFPFVLRGCLMYEVAILSAQACLMASLYFLFRAVFTSRHQLCYWILAGTMCGLTAGCRPQMALVGPLLAAFLPVACYCRYRTLLCKQSLQALLGFGSPLLACASLLAIYNYVRFDSICEFGAKYSLVGGTVNQNTLTLFTWQHFWYDLPRYLFNFPGRQAGFPYIFPQIPSTLPLPGTHVGVEPVLGNLFCAPFLLILAACPFVFYREWKQSNYLLLGTLSLLVAIGGINLTTVSLFGCSMRYTVDYIGPFLLASFLIVLTLDRVCIKVRAARWVLRMSFVSAALIGVTVNICISFVGQRIYHYPDQQVRQKFELLLPRFE